MGKQLGLSPTLTILLSLPLEKREFSVIEGIFFSNAGANVLAANMVNSLPLR